MLELNNVENLLERAAESTLGPVSLSVRSTAPGVKQAAAA
jgi:hypothetical protein